MADSNEPEDIRSLNNDSVAYISWIEQSSPEGSYALRFCFLSSDFRHGMSSVSLLIIPTIPNGSECSEIIIPTSRDCSSGPDTCLIALSAFGILIA